MTSSTGNWYGYWHFDDSTSTSAPAPMVPHYGNFGTIHAARDSAGRDLQHAHVRTLRAVNEARVDFTRIASSGNQPTDSKVSLSSLGFVTGPGHARHHQFRAGYLAIRPAHLAFRSDRLQLRPQHQRDRAVQQHLARVGQLLQDLAEAHASSSAATTAICRSTSGTSTPLTAISTFDGYGDRP